ncbi:hypothetical protein [Caulobacter sp. BK020]|uniref:hypothetical protein n=1 Tax=Caulobacter sp. BK020 TaxID=2512117 RepID=UPI001050FA83|nr:hypothetical protein [Caulobacter sp. BK020]TCS18424.1 hypothetical protein EV278_101408 [Caulobacter sp. BK020]
MRKTLRHVLLKGLAIGALAVSAVASTLVAPASAQSYSWQTVKIGGGGYVPAVIAHPGQQNLFYARTDVGGAYRYNSSNSTWVPLLDGLTPSQAAYDNVQAIAIDPNNTQKLYMVAGGGHDWQTNCCGGVLISNNQGASFTIVPLTFELNGNERGRSVGERLQVDPNLGSVLLYGTANTSAGASTNGLWKSTDSGAHWSKVTSFPAMSNNDTGAGVSFVAFYKPSGSSGQATPRIFAAVSTPAAASSGATLYQSTNGGSTWSQVPGAPTGQLPQRGQIGPDGNLYITYSQHDSSSSGWGPDGLVHGEVWKYNIPGNSWTNITPPNDSQQLAGWFADYGFSGLSVDPAHSGVVAVMSINRYDGHGEALFRTTNGGANWVDATANVNINLTAAPWNGTRGYIGNWSGVALDPFNTNHAFVTWGGGIMSTQNLTASANGQTVNFALDQNGVEEGVPLSLASPGVFSWGGSVPLVSGMGDMCGFFHASLTQPPAEAFSNPTCGNTTSLDWAKSTPSILVRVGQFGSAAGGISYNGGYSWSPFTSNPAGATANGGGNVAINADGSAIVWSPGDSGVAPAVSTNSTYSWTSTSLPAGTPVVADGANVNNFYAYDRTNGKVYVSTNKGASWTQPVTPIAWHTLITPFGKSCDVWLYGYSGLVHNTTCGSGTWTTLSGPTSVQAMGFGKAASGQSYPAIYVSATLNGVVGVYRSVNGGSSWAKIDDAQHQYGGFRMLTGDPKTFGTVYAATNSGRGVIVGTSPN